MNSTAATMVAALAVFVISATAVGIIGWLAYFIVSSLLRMWDLRQLRKRPQHTRLFIYALGQSQNASWVARIMNNGQWRRYECTKHYLVPEDRIWNYIVGEGSRGLKSQN